MLVTDTEIIFYGFFVVNRLQKKTKNCMNRQGYSAEKKRTFSAQSATPASFGRRVLILVVVVVIMFLMYQFYLHLKMPSTVIETAKQAENVDTKSTQDDDKTIPKSKLEESTTSVDMLDKESIDEINLLETTDQDDLQNPFERKITPKTISYQVHSWGLPFY